MKIYVTIAIANLDWREYESTSETTVYVGINKDRAFNTKLLRDGDDGLIVQVWENEVQKVTWCFDAGTDEWKIV
jgi:hypothetical protein